MPAGSTEHSANGEFGALKSILEHFSGQLAEVRGTASEALSEARTGGRLVSEHMTHCRGTETDLRSQIADLRRETDRLIRELENRARQSISELHVRADRIVQQAGDARRQIDRAVADVDAKNSDARFRVVWAVAGAIILILLGICGFETVFILKLLSGK